jgi:hypothetical protein
MRFVYAREASSRHRLTHLTKYKRNLYDKTSTGREMLRRHGNAIAGVFARLRKIERDCATETKPLSPFPRAAT